MPKSFHFTKYQSFLFMTLLSKISSMIHSSSPSMISGSGVGRKRLPGIGSAGAGVSLTTLETG
jgi:hypothetical protein